MSFTERFFFWSRNHCENWYYKELYIGSWGVEMVLKLGEQRKIVMAKQSQLQKSSKIIFK